MSPRQGYHGERGTSGGAGGRGTSDAHAVRRRWPNLQEIPQRYRYYSFKLCITSSPLSTTTMFTQVYFSVRQVQINNVYVCRLRKHLQVLPTAHRIHIAQMRKLLEVNSLQGFLFFSCITLHCITCSYSTDYKLVRKCINHNVALDMTTR